jgi:uncharacterized protein (TIGR03437 family)
MTRPRLRGHRAAGRPAPLLPLLFCLPAVGWCQKPVIFPNGVVNAATYQITVDSGPVGVGYGLSGGAIVSIFGTNLAASTVAASTTPLPTELGGTSILVNGGASPVFTAPLFFVSPQQINFQMPTGYNSNFKSPANIVVKSPAGASDPYLLDISGAPGIFTRDASGCRQGVVFNVRADGSMSPNAAEDSVSPGEFIAIYGTGQGIVNNSPPDGFPAQSTSPLATASVVPGLHLDFIPSGPYGLSFWAGRAPGLVGVDQFNFNIPDSVRQGCAVPLQVSTLDGISQPVTISVRKGGGPCVDPPPAGYGQITWEKSVTIASPSSSTETAGLTVSLQAAPGKQVPPPLAPNITSRTYFGPACPLPGYRSLDAGGITIQGPGLDPLPAPLVPLEDTQVGGLKIYRAAVAPGAIQPGSFTVRASGGADVGSFESSATIGPEIHITTQLAGTVLVVSNLSAPTLSFSWTGGDANEQVMARLVRHLGYVDWWGAPVTVPATAGTLTIGGTFLTGFGIGVGPVELVVEVSPAAPPAFTAAGLSLGGQHLWKYTYRYQGLLLQ